MKNQKFEINPHINTIRKEYNEHILLEENCHKDPFIQFQKWMQDAIASDPDHANAMTLSTVDEAGMPDSRVVLLRNISYGGFTFYTNYHSKKGRDIESNPHAALLFFWKELGRQIRIRGELKLVPVGESEAYFKERPFESKVGTWASRQSEIIGNRKELDEAVEREFRKYKDAQVPRPEHWGGYVLLPVQFEFWQGRPSRLHDRIQFQLDSSSKEWKMSRLMP